MKQSANKAWKRVSHATWQHVPTGAIVEKNHNPTGIRNWWVSGGGDVGVSAATKGCLGGFFKLATAKKWIEHFDRQSNGKA